MTNDAKDLRIAAAAVARASIERATTTVIKAQNNAVRRGSVLRADADASRGELVGLRQSKPGQGISIRIRGQVSVSAGSDPLYVIDGVPVDKEGISGASNPLSLINPSDIETLTEAWPQ